MSTYRKSPKATAVPVTAPIPLRKSKMVENHDGGYVFEANPLKALEMFLILGVEGNTYYVSKETKLREADEIIEAAIARDAIGALDLVCEISKAGRAAKNEQAIYVLAQIMTLADPSIKQLAAAGMGEVVRTGTHFHHFCAYIDELRGWGQVVRRAISKWLNSHSPDDLAFQIGKYGQRDGWAWADALRLAHPRLDSEGLNAVARWALGKGEAPAGWPQLFELAKNATTAGEVIALIEKGLPIEAFPSQFKDDPDVWRALLPKTPPHNLLRNLVNLGKYGVLAEGRYKEIDLVAKRLDNTASLRKARVHPADVFKAWKIYESGGVPRIVDALENAMYECFANVEPTGKNYLIGVDVSGSMTIGSVVGIPDCCPYEAAAFLAMLTVRTEDNVVVKGFSRGLSDLPLRRKMSFSEVARLMRDQEFDYTDLGQLIEYAHKQLNNTDVFLAITDGEINQGNHPQLLLEKYRRAHKPNAKAVFIATEVQKFSVFDPADLGAMSMGGFDANHPKILREFVLA